MDISGKILSDPLSCWVFSAAKNRAYLVGGYLRDLLRNKTSRDRDFVIDGNAALIAEKTARKFGGTFVELHEQTFRVALKNGQFADFTKLSGGILDDLHRRDFTVNAIAWSPVSGIVTPSRHLSDLSHKVIRVIKPENLLHDPLRLIRAYRIAAQLKFTIDPETGQYLARFASHIPEAAPERITEELYKMLNINYCLNYIELCNKHKVLSHVLGCAKRVKGSHIRAIRDVDHLLIKLTNYKKYKNFITALHKKQSQGLTGCGLVRFYFLTRCMEISRIPCLRLSTANRNALDRLRVNEKFFNRRMTERLLLHIFKRAGLNIYEIALVISSSRKRSSLKIIDRAQHFNKIKNNLCINGEEIMKMLKTGSGPVIGEIKDRIFDLQYSGIIRNRREARKWMISNLT